MPKLEKRILAQYLRVQCDRFLHHSLFRAHPREGIPLPLSGRPGVQVFKDRGLEFEQKKREELSSVFPESYEDAQRAVKDSQSPDQKLASLLTVKPDVPRFLVEPPLGAKMTRTQLLDSLGVDSAHYPDFPDFRPDVVMVIPRKLSDFDSEVRPNGTVVPVATSDPRNHLRVIDMKATEKLNPSYASEVVAYSMVLASWLEAMSLEDEFLVVSTPAVWVNSKLFPDYLPSNSDPLSDRQKWLDDQLLDAEAELYAPPVVKFLTEDIPRVLKADDWQDLDWGVAPTCSQCDYLGYPAWTRTALDKAKTQAKERKWSAKPTLDDYCYSEAIGKRLAMQIPDLTVGMRRALNEQGLTSLNDISSLEPTDPTFRSHHGLLQQAYRLPPKADAILAKACETNRGYQTAQMAAYADLRLTISVSFDASSQLLIGLGLGIDYREPTPFEAERKQPLTRKQVLSFLVPRESLDSERDELVDFLRTISSMILWIGDERSYPTEVGEPSASDRAKYAKGKARVQVLFWDRRQEEALRQAIARHLPTLQNLGVLPAAIWLFPPEETIESDKTAETPPVCYLRDVLTRLYILPTIISDDVVSTAEGLVGFKARLSDFEWDRIAGVIPKERALEIWQGMPPRRPPKSLSECRKQYQRTLETLVHGMRQLAFHAVMHEKSAFRGKAPRVKDLLPTAFMGVATDALLWLTHLAVEEGVGRLETKITFTGEPYDAEASFEALRTTGQIKGVKRENWLKHYGLEKRPNRLVFRVRKESKYSKFRNGERFLTLVPEKPVGSALLRAERFVEAQGATQPDYSEPHWEYNEYAGLHAIMGATLKFFDRENQVAVIDLTSFGNRGECRRSLKKSGALHLNEPMVLYKSYGWPIFAQVQRVAKAIGNPPTATPSTASVQALPKVRKPGRSAHTPAAEVLWEPTRLVNTPSRLGTKDKDRAILYDLAATLEHYPNPSQLKAVEDCLARRLNLVWGGPGTGKTTTLVLAILSDALISYMNRKTTRTLISTFSYRALSEITSRFHEWIPNLSSEILRSLKNCRFTFLVSQGRGEELGVGDGPLGGLVRTVVIGDGGNSHATEDGTEALGISLNSICTKLESASPKTIEIVFAPCHQVLRLATKDEQKIRRGLFDRVWIDESSQLSVAHSLSLFALLDENSSVGVFGDRLQMPPVQRIAPPKGAEHLVGGIQGYLLSKIHEGGSDYRESFLDINYRSCEPIVAFSRAIGYEKSFKADNADQELRWDSARAKVNWDTEAVPDFSLTRECLVPERPCVAITYDDGCSGQANEFEAALVSACVLQYRANECSEPDFDEERFWDRKIGIVTPHRAQRAVIVAMLHAALKETTADLRWIEDAVDTVERFQGGERELILVSFGLGDPDVIQREEEFLFQKERINVAVTRARSKVIVFVTRDLGLHLPDDSRVAEASKILKHFVYHHADQELAPEKVTYSGREKDVIVRYRGY